MSASRKRHGYTQMGPGSPVWAYEHNAPSGPQRTIIRMDNGYGRAPLWAAKYVARDGRADAVVVFRQMTLAANWLRWREQMERFLRKAYIAEPELIRMAITVSYRSRRKL